MLDEKTKNRIRYHLDCPVQGVMNSGFSMSYRMFTPAATLEYRMLNLQVHEEAELTGQSTGSIRILGANPLVGDTLTMTIGTSTVTYTVTSADVASTSGVYPNPLYSIALNAANAWNRNSGSAISASAGPPALFSAPVALPPYAEVTFQSMTYTPFKIITSSTGHTATFVGSQGSSPAFQFNFIDADGTTTVPIYGLIPILDYLDMQILQAMDNLAFTKAESVQFSAHEAQARQDLYERYRGRLSMFMGVKIAPVGNPNQGGGFVL